MKKIIFCTFLMFVAGANMFAQSIDSKKIGALLVAQKYADLSEFFADNVVITLDEQEESYPKSKAIEVLQAFFIENPPTKYTLQHQGNSGGDKAAWFGVGVLRAGDLELDTQFLIRNNKVIEMCFE